VKEDCEEDVKDALSVDEVKSAIDALTLADQEFLMNSANFFCKINALSEPMSLLQEAFTRALTGQRKCRRNLQFVPFLYGAMRSIADSTAKAAKRSIIDPLADPEEAEEEQLTVDAEDLVTPEREAAAREALQRVDDLFQDDQDVRLLLEAMADRLKGQELRDALGWDKTQHNTIRRRMLRKCELHRDDLE
jgi:DNA-directed RNA polymerase specialized sigma24 family protein